MTVVASDSLGRDATEAAWRHHYDLAMAQVGAEAKQRSAYHYFESDAADTAWAANIDNFREAMARHFAAAADSRT